MTDTHDSTHDARTVLPAEGGTIIQWVAYNHRTGDLTEHTSYDDAIGSITRCCRSSRWNLDRPEHFGVYMQANAYTGWKEMGDGYGRNTSGNPTGTTDTSAQ